MLAWFIFVVMNIVPLVRCGDRYRFVREFRCPVCPDEHAPNAGSSAIGGSGVVGSAIAGSGAVGSAIAGSGAAVSEGPPFKWHDQVHYTFESLEPETQNSLQTKWDDWKQHYNAKPYDIENDRHIMDMFTREHPSFAEILSRGFPVGHEDYRKIVVPDYGPQEFPGEVRFWMMDLLALKLYTSMTNDCKSLRASFRLDCYPSIDACRAKHIFWNDALNHAFRHYHDYYIKHKNDGLTSPFSGPIKFVFHGMSNVCLDFKHLFGRAIDFNGPLSTSRSITTARNFAGDQYGIILRLQPVGLKAFSSHGFIWPIEINKIIINKNDPSQAMGVSEYSHEEEILYMNTKFIVKAIIAVHSENGASFTIQRPSGTSTKIVKKTFMKKQKPKPRKSGGWKQYEECKEKIEEFEKTQTEATVLGYNKKELEDLKMCYIHFKYGYDGCWKLYSERIYAHVTDALASKSSYDTFLDINLLYLGFGFVSLLFICCIMMVCGIVGCMVGIFFGTKVNQNNLLK